MDGTQRHTNNLQRQTITSHLTQQPSPGRHTDDNYRQEASLSSTATGGGASSTGGGVGDSVSDGVGGGAAADKDMPNDTKDEIDFLTREITEDERTVAAAASIVNEKRDRLQHLQRMLAPSTKTFAKFLDEGRIRPGCAFAEGRV